MNLVMWVLVAVLVGLVAAYATKRGGHGPRWDIALGLTGSIVVSWIFQSRWVSPDPSLVAGIVVAAIGAAGAIVAQRRIWPALTQDPSRRSVPARRAGVHGPTNVR